MRYPRKYEKPDPESSNLVSAQQQCIYDMFEKINSKVDKLFQKLDVLEKEIKALDRKVLDLKEEGKDREDRERDDQENSPSLNSRPDCNMCTIS